MKIFLALLLLYSQFAQGYVAEIISSFSVDAGYLRSIVAKENKRWRLIFSEGEAYYHDALDQKRISDKVIFFNLTSKQLKKIAFNQLRNSSLTLFMWEPPTVLPEMYQKMNQRWFTKIYTWDDELVDDKRFFKFYYPALLPMLPIRPSFEEKKLCTLVASNLAGHGTRSLYQEREKAISFFEQVGEKGFEFYGKGWSSSKHPSYRGPTPDKLATIKHYRFSICYENTKDMTGYITEKIFDCFAAGNVPIYWGASNIDEYIPMNCFIDRRHFETMDDLYHFIKTMPKEQYEAYISNIAKFLSSEQAKKFSRENFERLFSHAICQ